MKNAFDINGAAYTDMICATTRKSAQEISKELGFEESYLKGIKKYNRVRISTANLIEKMYGVSVSPFIVLPKKPEPEAPAPNQNGLAHEIAMEVADLVEERVLKFLDLKLGGFVLAKTAEAPNEEVPDEESHENGINSAANRDEFIKVGLEYGRKMGLKDDVTKRALANCFDYYEARDWKTQSGVPITDKVPKVTNWLKGEKTNMRLNSIAVNEVAR